MSETEETNERPKRHVHIVTIDGAADVLAGFVDIETLKRLKEFAE